MRTAARSIYVILLPKSLKLRLQRNIKLGNLVSNLVLYLNI